MAFFFHLFQVSLRFLCEIVGQGRKICPGFPGKEGQERDHFRSGHSKGRPEWEQRLPHPIEFFAEGPGNVKVQVILHGAFEEGVLTAVFLHHQGCQLQPEMDVLSDDAVPHLPALGEGKSLLPEKGKQGRIYGAAGVSKTPAGQGIEPAAHAFQKDPRNLYFLLSHLFIVHEGHLPSRKMKGNFFYYTPETGGSGLAEMHE